MRTDFINNSIKIKNQDHPFDPFLLENNEKQIGDICHFLQNDYKLMLIKGFKGTGKALICDFIVSNLNPEVLILNYKSFETTTLDDMLLAFFEIFRKYTEEGRFEPPKLKAENFTQKINTYFNCIAAPIMIIINSFDAILKSNRQDILNFILHLTNHSNVKIIITSKKFNAEDFENTNFYATTLLAFTPEIYEKFLKANGVKQPGILATELYKHSRGYYNNIKLSVDIMHLREYDIGKFLDVFSKSLMTFSDFITREALSLVDPVSAHLFRLLAMMRIPIHINLLKSLNLYDENRVNFFIKNSILLYNNESLYLDNDLREVVEHQIPENVAIKLHSACIDLYNTQLPLKPLERDLRLSRQTMRNEIEYHSMFLPKKFVPTEPAIKTSQIQIETPVQIEETKEDKIKKINFIVEDEAVLNNIADSIKDFVSQKTETQELSEQSNGLGVTKLINLARKEEGKYNYKHAIMLYQNALTKKDDPDFLKFLPKIYINLAKNYKNLSKWHEALEYYTQAQDFYYNTSNNEKMAEVKLEIANIYYIIYKNDNAKFILNELEKDKTLSNELKMKINIALGKLSNSTEEAFEYYKKAIEYEDNTVSKSTLAELYYKFAGVNDEKNYVKNALNFYKKCIDIEPNPDINKYISRAMASLAELYDEAGATETAIQYYENSMEIDKKIKNYNGLYCSARNLSEIYSSKDVKKSLEYLQLACEYAKQLNEPYYMADSALEIGNYYLLRKNYDNAYKYFSQAYNVTKISFNSSDSEKILSKIQTIKNQIGEYNFQKLKEKYE
ncbi:tetratricopeptide repeat protein [bacterium]|nr:tetratricopeptide repeat protein [bacterium]